MQYITHHAKNRVKGKISLVVLAIFCLKRFCYGPGTFPLTDAPHMPGKKSLKNKKVGVVGWMGECLYMNWNLCFSSSVSYRKDIEWSEYACLMEKASFYVQVLFLLLCLIFYWCWRKKGLYLAVDSLRVRYVLTYKTQSQGRMRIRGCLPLAAPDTHPPETNKNSLAITIKNY